MYLAVTNLRQGKISN